MKWKKKVIKYQKAFDYISLFSLDRSTLAKLLECQQTSIEAIISISYFNIHSILYRFITTFIRMILKCQFVISFLYVILAAIRIDIQNLIIVLHWKIVERKIWKIEFFFHYLLFDFIIVHFLHIHTLKKDK